jgi:CRISPR/Cas system-associated protein Cas5 (RAMP superfamily)
MQSDLIADDEERHFVFIDFISTIHHKNFEVILENDLRASYKKKEEMSDLIATILLISKESIIRVELIHQCLHRIQRIKLVSTQLSLQIIDISKSDQRIVIRIDHAIVR